MSLDGIPWPIDRHNSLSSTVDQLLRDTEVKFKELTDCWQHQRNVEIFLKNSIEPATNLMLSCLSVLLPEMLGWHDFYF